MNARRSILLGTTVLLCTATGGLRAEDGPAGSLAASVATNAPAIPLAIQIDASRKTGTIRALHGINGGPLCLGGMVDVSKYHRAIGIPATRVHDANWPRGDVVDIHTIFPVFSADTDNPASYRFAPTDDYLLAITGVGSKVMYRLGESFELPTSTKYYVMQPPDFDQWSKICLGIIRHYNEGWANGHKLGLEYFEIWNEVEIGKMFWSGRKEEYYRLYATAARTIKARYPALKIGGPAAAGTILMKDGKLELSKFVRGFLDYCKKEAVPLDFFTWHQYALKPSGEVPVARELRKLLDDYGFTKTEMHFNEWNYLPGGKMDPLWSRDSALMTWFFGETGSMRAAAYSACMLLAMQDTPVDMMNYYTGDNGFFGMFTTYGLPRKPYYSFLAFKALVDHPARVDLQGARPDELHAMAGLSTNATELAVVLSNFQSPAGRVEIDLRNLPWTGPSECEIMLLDATHNLEPLRKEQHDGTALKVVQDLPAPGVLLLYVRPRKP